MSELNPLTLPLSGRQLIEASAGTGKTYNITRLYIRLLLEQKVKVQNILVMTFTNAATQELRLRLDAELRVALMQWSDDAVVEDPFYQSLKQQYRAQEARLLLNRALQNLDEAAVFTIHGFCKRVLADQAFESGMRFDAQIDTNLSDLYLQAVQDLYRRYSRNELFEKLATRWPTPEIFFKSFGNLVRNFDVLEQPKSRDQLPQIDWHLAWPEQELDSFQKYLVNNRRSPAIKSEWQEVCDQLSKFVSDSIEGQKGDTKEHELFGFLGSQADFRKKKQHYPVLHAAVAHFKQQEQLQLATIIHDGVNWCRDRVKENKLQKNAMDFDDLIRILSEQLDASNGNHLAEVLAKQYPIALVDEFQDTDAQQYSILDKIYRADNARLLVMIGDPKQAIYGFRGGDIFAYLQARNTANAHWQMSTNYRSTAGVIAGYNQLFSATTPSSFDFNIDYQNINAGLADSKELADPASNAAFQWVLFDGEKLAKNAMNDLAHWTSNEILRLIDNVKNGDTGLNSRDMAILVRNRGEADIMRRSLALHGLESVYLSNRENLWASHEAVQLLILLQGIQKSDNNRLLVSCLSTHWFSLSQQELHRLSIDDAFHTEWRIRLENLHEHWQRHGLLSMAFKILAATYQSASNQRDRQMTNDIHLLETVQEAANQFSDSRELIVWLEQQIHQNNGEKELRLESDENLIKIVTLHGSKGLEYPVVFLPFVSYGSSQAKAKHLIRVHHESDHISRQVILPDQQQLEREQREQEAELVRLLYVAVTRAEKRLYVLAAPFTRVTNSPLGLALRTADFASLNSLISELYTPEAIIHQNLPMEVNTQKASSRPESQSLACQKFTGNIERDWWLSSFTALSRNIRHDGLSSPERETDNNGQEDTEIEPTDIRYLLAKGAQSGNMLHWILETIEFSNPEFLELKDQLLARYSHILNPLFPDNDLTPLFAWIQDVLDASLDDNGLQLGNLDKHQSLKETEFYFPMQVLMENKSVISELLATHRQKPVEFPQQHKLKGMMHGFIDLVFEWQGQFYVADYKSNWLGSDFEDYDTTSMENSIQHSFYDLQYWIYSLALHRYLKVNLADYDPQQHFGGVYYLYLRGMSPGNLQGIYHNKPDVTWLDKLDAIFDGQQLESEPATGELI